MSRPRIVIAIAAIAGAIVGAVLGVFAAPHPTHFTATATVVMSPDPAKSGGDVTAFWSVLDRGQITRQAAALLKDPRWLPEAAAAADVPQSDLSLDAYMLAETMILKVTVTSTSLKSADAALNEVLRVATPSVEQRVEPFTIGVMWPPEGNAQPLPVPSASQVGAAGALWGGLISAALAAAFRRWKRHKQHDSVRVQGSRNPSRADVRGYTGESLC